MNEIVINWHIIEKCNYKCAYCFAKYGKTKLEEVHKSPNKIVYVLEKVYEFLADRYKNYGVRLNIAGGEPLLAKNLHFILKEANKIGFDTSIITNGSLVDEEFLQTSIPLLSMFAVSVDSVENESCQQIGRSAKKQVLSQQKLEHIFTRVKTINPAIKTKINTVVNQYNFHQNLSQFIGAVQPSKWKIFQAMDFDNQRYCTKQQFDCFVNTHKDISIKTFVESSQDMKNSYLMIDPCGRFYQNSHSGYQYSSPIFDSSVEDCVASVGFDYDKFCNRY